MPERLLPKWPRRGPDPDAQETLRFCVDVLGLEHSGTEGASAFLRGWGDFFHHTLQVTEGDAPGSGTSGGRAEAPTSSRRQWRGSRRRERARGGSRTRSGTGARIATAARVVIHELFWEVERFEAPPELVSPFPNRPQRYVPRGAALRCIDHVTVATAIRRPMRAGSARPSATATWSTR